MVIYIAGSIPLFRGKRSNHFRLQRQSKHGCTASILKLLFYHLGISKPSLLGKAGNLACGSAWYQKVVDEISDFWLL